MTHLGDITKLDGSVIPVVDVITGGSPCQDLSIAGQRKGLAGERSGLFMEQVRIVKEMREHDRRRNGRSDGSVRPRFMVWENVPGAFSSNKGEDFRAVLEEIVRVAAPDAPDVSMPERGKCPKSGILYSEMGRWSVAWRVHDAQFLGVPQRRKRIALVADFGGLSAPEILFERKSMSWDSDEGEAERKETAAGVGIGTSGAVTLRIRGRCEGGGKGPLIQTEKTGTLGCNQDQTLFVLNDQGGSVMSVSEDTAGTLRAQEHGHQPVIAFTQNQRDEVRNLGDVDGALAAEPGMKQQTFVAYVFEPGAAQSKENGGYSLNYQNPIREGLTVRRLTPLECERLQGYPDGWTDIGEWIDSKGKKHKAADTPRYKALGNSIALPYWKVLLKRISAQYDRDATLGSLFDGIGGFPYLWEQINGKGSALWASEIDEFPIAVTKKRFPEGTT